MLSICSVYVSRPLRLSQTRGLYRSMERLLKFLSPILPHLVLYIPNNKKNRPMLHGTEGFYMGQQGIYKGQHGTSRDSMGLQGTAWGLHGTRYMAQMGEHGTLLLTWDMISHVVFLDMGRQGETYGLLVPTDPVSSPLPCCQVRKSACAVQFSFHFTT